MQESEKEVVLSLISHTNVGKTTLARTLLRQDVGEMLDQAHVTEENEVFEMLRVEDLTLKLWDTPGFGDTVRLLKRLKKSGNPMGWFLHQVWDRLRDRPLWCSQHALQNVQEEADVVMYLVDATLDPISAGYVDLEMQILEWIGKPCIVLLNRTGVPKPDREEVDVAVWQAHLEDKHPIVREVMALDACTRCWVMEHQLIDSVSKILTGQKRKTCEILGHAWLDENKRIFEESSEALAKMLVSSAADSQAVSEATLAQKLGWKRNQRNKELERARASLSQRLSARKKETLNTLIRINGISGESAASLSKYGENHFGNPKNVNEPIAAVVTGAVTGLASGLGTDIVSGGLTFGGGMLVGSTLGAIGAYGLSKTYNLAVGIDNSVHWSEAHFREQFQTALLSYLSLAHFGRGRGFWQEDEPPKFWIEMVSNLASEKKDRIAKIWKRALTENSEEARQALEKSMFPLVRECLRELLTELYPDVRVF